MAVTHFRIFRGKCKGMNGRDDFSVRIYSKYLPMGNGLLPTWQDINQFESQDIDIMSLNISYDSEGDDKYAPVIASKLSVEIAITNNNTGNQVDVFRKHLRDTWAEGDVTVAVFTGGAWQNNRFWAGNVMIDLGEEADEDRPTSFVLTATDGIGLLKKYDMVKLQGTNPYSEPDTYLGLGYRTIDYWLIEIFEKCRVPGLDETSYQIPKWTFYKSMHWCYDDQDCDLEADPLMRTEIQMLGYMETAAGGYTCPTAYDVLVAICKMFNARLCYWGGDFFFTQINLFNEAETGSSGSPENIRTFHRYNAVLHSTFQRGIMPDWANINNYEPWGEYQQIMRYGAQSGGLNRMSGANFTNAPQVKRVTCIFDSYVGNQSYYQGFPEQNTSGQMTPNAEYNYFQSTLLGTHTDADTFSGFLLKIPLDWTQVAPGSPTYYDSVFNWSIRARPAGASNWSYYLKEKPATATTYRGEWVPYPNVPASGAAAFNIDQLSGVSPNWFDMIGYNRYQYTLTGVTNPLWIFDDIIATSPNFTGDWELELFTHGYSGDMWIINASGTSINVSSPATIISTGHWFMGNMVASIGSANQDGMIMPHGHGGRANSWTDSMDTSVNPPLFKGMFQPFSSTAVGATATVTQIYSAREDTDTMEVAPIIWGDTVVPGESNSIRWKDTSGTGASNNGYTDAAGKWGFDFNGPFDKTLAELICQDRLNNMAKSCEILSGTIVLSGRNMLGEMGTDQFINPLGRLMYKEGQSKAYMFKRGTWNLGTDEVEGEWIQVVRAVVSGTTTTTGSGQSDDGNQNAGAKLAGPQVEVLLSQPIGSVRTESPVQDPLEYITTLDTDGFLEHVSMKAGDTILITARERQYQMTLSADWDLYDDTVSVESVLITHTIQEGSGICVSTKALIEQNRRQTVGSVGGMDVTATTIDGATRLGRTEISFRGEGNSLETDIAYVLNGEDNTRSGRFGTQNALSPTDINAQQSLKSGIFLADNDYTIESGRIAISGTVSSVMNIKLYKVTPVDGSSSNLNTTLMGSATATMEGNATTNTAAFSLSVDPDERELATGDIIVPEAIVTLDESGGETNFRGQISFTLIHT